MKKNKYDEICKLSNGLKKQIHYHHNNANDRFGLNENNLFISAYR